MSATLIKAVIAFVPTVLLMVGSTVVFLRRRDLWSGFQLFGSTCLVIVVLTHVCEALGWLRAMGWGQPDSVGHYLDLSSAVVGVTLFPMSWIKTRTLW